MIALGQHGPNMFSQPLCAMFDMLLMYSVLTRIVDLQVWYASHAYLVRPDDKQEVEQASHQSMSASGKLVWDYSMASTSHMGASTPYEHLLSGTNT